ncbi:MAG: GNAT family N-acetyltransferase [Anaerolineales bacterium]|nr:GNAT family N-acetyltransferase [Anaerolineales bacterium]
MLPRIVMEITTYTQPSPLLIRPATLADAAAMHRIHTEAVQGFCQDHYSEAQIAAWLRGRSPAGYHGGINTGHMFLAEQAGAAVGFAHAEPGIILAMFVDAGSAGQGVGGKLLDHALRLARQGVREIKLTATLNAQSFYEKAGFQPTRPVAIHMGAEQLPFVAMTLPLNNPAEATK